MIERKKVLWLGIMAGFSLGVYLFASQRTYGIGFPLDDAWIHQTYARNLAQTGVWAFIPGKPSGGSTSPLWSAILAVGNLVGLGPYVWTYLLGWFALWGISVVGTMMFEQLIPERKALGFWVGVFFALEWHLAWYAGSGMETLLYALVVMAALKLVLNIGAGWKESLGMGVLVGLSTWLRPDGITLLGPAIFVLALGKAGWRKKALNALLLVGGFSALFLPYLGFNKWVSGSWWPNTFYAKQAEYAILQEVPMVSRFLGQFKMLLVGAGVVLLPGIVWITWQAVRKKQVGIMGMLIWVLGYLGLYTWRLPVNYQHGRYVIPAMPVFLLLGLVGMGKWAQCERSGKWSWAIRTGWMAVLALVTLGMWVQGARAYSQDVALIETEMVETAHWLADNTGEDDVIAVHDIGAVGYFCECDILDLAGLISPDVIPFIRDEGKLSDYLDDKGADFLVTFPGWYPELVRGKKLVFQTNGRVSLIMGGENMAIYQWGGVDP